MSRIHMTDHDPTPEMRLIWAHENDDTLDEWGVFIGDKCVAKFEGENQARMYLEDLIRSSDLPQPRPSGHGQ